MPDALRLVIVTPERTLLDEPVSALRFPLYDGDIGILPGRLPLIGRLGAGELKLTSASGERSYFIDGGFAQVEGSVVSILTQRAIPVEELTTANPSLRTRTTFQWSFPRGMRLRISPRFSPALMQRSPATRASTSSLTTAKTKPRTWQEPHLRPPR